MSRVPIWCEMVCRTCSNQIVGEFTYGSIRRRSLSKEARTRGAILMHDEVFCSHRCLEAFEKEGRLPGGDA